MLIEFRLQNHRSICDEQAITMEAGRAGDPGDPRPRRIHGNPERLLTVAGIYGANASGKSNLVSGLAFMRDAVLRSHRTWAPEGGVPRDPFEWGGWVTQPSMFEVRVILDGVRYQYGFVADADRFLEEWLYAWPKGRKQSWIRRVGDEFQFGDYLSGENRLVEQVTRENALFLSAAVQHRHEQLRPLYAWFRDLRTVNVRGRYRSGPSWVFPGQWLVRRLEEGGNDPAQPSLFEEEGPPAAFSSFRQLLRGADVGIVDLRVDEAEPDEEEPMWSRKKILVQHRSSLGDGWLPLEQESQGTLTLFRIGPMMLDALERGGLLVVDELEASLHPLLAIEIVRQFNNPTTNPHHAQLVFTTHDTNLLGSVAGDAPLRRDQVWLTEKDDRGATVVYPLTDFKPRKAENLERGYLLGRYGAVPFLGDLTVADAREES